jgi:hypothetical protein
MNKVFSFIDKKLKAFRNPRIFFTNRSGIMDNIMPYFMTAPIKRARMAVLFQDVIGKGLEYAREAKRSNKKVLVIQHGRGAVDDYIPPQNKTLLADAICVWGTRDQKLMLRNGFSSDRVILTGCPIFDGLSAEKKKHKGINVLFAPGHTTEDGEEFLSSLHIVQQLKKMDGINVFVKLLSTHDTKPFGKNTIVSRSFDADHIYKCIEAVKRSDILISNQPGTIDLIAMYFDIPVISIIDEKLSADIYGRYARRFDTSEKSFYDQYAFGAEIIRDINILPEAIKKNLSDPGKLKNDRRKELLESAGVGLPGSPVEKIVKIIKEMAQ